MNTNLFHPLIEKWFSGRFGEPTEPQRLGWPEIAAGRPTLITAPTGSGKTLAAFLACIDRLFREAAAGTLQDETQVLYVSPLKALSNDVRRNLEAPLEEIRELAANQPVSIRPIRALVRTGDTPAAERQAMLRKPPHILVTTPESLYLLLTGAKSREILRTVRTVIIDEIHALARDKRGSHLTLSLERLDAICHHKPVRIGLSATVQPVDQIAQFLTGRSGACDADSADPPACAGRAPCSIIDIGHVRELDIGIELPPSELSAVCSNEQWAEVYARLVELIQTHRSTLVFVNTRRLSERVAHHLRRQLGEDSVAAHHGSMSREIRLAAEERLKAGTLKAIVATASLELGIDVGFIDLVCQIGSPRSIATFLQRVGRSGHSLGRVPKGRLFPLTRDELIECLALVRAVRARRLDAVEVPVGPLDILAQQIIAAVSCEEWDESELYALCRGAWPYRDLSRADYDAILEMVSEGIGGDRRRGAYLHRDQVNHRLRARRGARIAAITSGGAIPEVGDYRVVTESDRTFVGTVNEDFAIESSAGDVFILGNSSWRIRYVRGGEVVVNDAQGAPATIPFWLGEAPARTIELSGEISRLREELAERLEQSAAARSDSAFAAAAPLDIDSDKSTEPADAEIASPAALDDAAHWLARDCAVDQHAARQAVHYVAAQYAAIGLVPSGRRIVFERFFDESGGMQLVIHAPLGGRINRAWGLAMRKRFCRSFDFELQAAADDNGIVLALGPQHSFPISDMFKMLRPDNAEHMLVQALLAVPMFPTRWRWNATRALAVLRQRNGKKVPPFLQKFRADDLLTAVFPACTACLENRPEDLPIPDQPLVRQTIYDCLHEAMDIDRFVSVLADIEAGRVELVARDTREPSPFSHQLLNANPYAFLDDAPLEERRTRAVTMRRSFSVESVRDLGRLDQAAIDQVRSEAWPLVRDPDELHDALLLLAALPEQDGKLWCHWFQELVHAGRAVRLHRPALPALWVAAERIELVRDAFPDAMIAAQRDGASDASGPAAEQDTTSDAGGPPARRGSEARIALVRGRLDCLGPLTATQIAEQLGLQRDAVFLALEVLEGEGFAMRGQFTPHPPGRDGNGSPDREVEWCARRLLARIHRLTLDGLRRQIQPVDTAQFIQFLLEHQRVAGVNPLRGRRALVDMLEQLQGFEAPAGAWEYDILPARVRDYDSRWLDELSLSGHVAWGRFAPPRRVDDVPARGTLTRAVPIALGFRDDMSWLVPGDRSDGPVKLRANAQIVLDLLSSRGALFGGDLAAATGLLPSQLDEALRELAALGLVTADGFAAIRSVAMSGRHGRAGPRRLAGWGRLSLRSEPSGGRWSLFAQPVAQGSPEQRAERWAQLLLRRYGIVFRDLLLRESSAPPWRDLVRIYRRSEAQGEVRGGRFVAGVAGEQFALPHAVDAVRRVRDEKTETADAVIILAASDPANVFAAITDGPRIVATRGNRIAVRGGRLIASLAAGTVQFHADVEPRQARELEQSLRMNALARHRHQQASHWQPT